MSKIEAGRVELSISPFQLRECIESAIDVIAAKAHSKGLEVQYIISQSVPLVVCLDYKRITQILFNLLSNATKFTSTGDVTVEVTVEKCEDIDPSISQTTALEDSESLLSPIDNTHTYHQASPSSFIHSDQFTPTKSYLLHFRLVSLFHLSGLLSSVTQAHYSLKLCFFLYVHLIVSETQE